MNGKRILAIVLVVLVIAGSLFLYSRANKRAQTAVPQGVKTAPVVRGSIEARISASGSLAAERTQPLTFKISGTVAEVLVKEGDSVKQGQVLARLDTRDLELSLKQAQAALQVSEASLARVRKAPSKEEIAAARAAVEAARASLQDLQTGPSEAEVAAAKAAVEAAKANLNDLKAGPSARDIRLADLAIAQAKNSLWGLQANRDSVRAMPGASQGAKNQAEAQVLNAEIQVEIAQINREKLNDPPKASVLKAAESQLAQAESALDRLTSPPRSSTLKAAESQLAQAESTLARLLSMPSPEDVAQAEAQVAQARVGVEIAQSRLNDAVLIAPFAGQLADWNLHVGDNVTPATPAGTLVDVSRYHVDVNIDETEISKVTIGQKVLITLDAFPDRELEGRVSKVSLLGSSAQGIVNYSVRIDLNPTDLPIKPLMTAVINIIVERKDNVLLVPNRALKRDKQGKYVEILDGQMPKRVYVTTGVSNEDSTEIVTGLEEGQQVIVSAPRVNILSGATFSSGG